MEMSRSATWPKGGEKGLRHFADDVQFDSVFLENRIGDLYEAGDILLLHYPMERTHDDHAPRRGRSDAPLARDPPVVSRGERQHANVVGIGPQRAAVLLGNRGHKIHTSYDPPLERGHLACIAPEHPPPERRSAGLAGHRAPQRFFMIVGYMHEHRRMVGPLIPICQTTVERPACCVT